MTITFFKKKCISKTLKDYSCFVILRNIEERSVHICLLNQKVRKNNNS